MGKGAEDAIMYVGNDMVEMSISDGQVFLTDRNEHNSPGAEDFTVVVPSGELKDIELELREMEGDVKIDLRDDSLEVNGWAYNAPRVTGVFIDELEILNPLYTAGLAVKSGTRPFALSPDRFRKFSLIKPGDFPMDFKHVWHSKLEREVLLWKAGPTVRGAIAALDREIIAKEVDTSEWLW